MWIVVLGTIALSCILIFFKLYSERYRKLDCQYGKPYKARLVKLVGNHPELRSGIYSIAFHPNGAISLNQKVITYSDIKSLEIVEHVEQDSAHTKHYLVMQVDDDNGENELYLTSKSEFGDIANELQRAWLKSKIC